MHHANQWAALSIVFGRLRKTKQLTKDSVKMETQYHQSYLCLGEINCCHLLGSYIEALWQATSIVLVTNNFVLCSAMHKLAKERKQLSWNTDSIGSLAYLKNPSLHLEHSTSRGWMPAIVYGYRLVCLTLVSLWQMVLFQHMNFKFALSGTRKNSSKPTCASLWKS